MRVRSRFVVILAAVSFVLGAAGPPPGATIQCDYGDAATCATYVQMALAVEAGQGPAAATAQVVAPQNQAVVLNGRTQFVLGARSGADLALVVLRDSAGSTTSLILIGTTGIGSTPGAWVADPASYPGWYAKYGYPSSYTGPRATLPPAGTASETFVLWAAVALAAAVIVRAGLARRRPPRVAT